MPLVRKNSITQFASTGCRKQLRLSMHPDTAAYASERAALQLPHRQLRPALREIQRAGDDWGYAKILDLQQAFGDDALIGGERTLVGGTSSPGLRIANTPLLPYLTDTLPAGRFLIETQYDVDNATFRKTHHLDDVACESTTNRLAFAEARPDVIETLAPAVGALLVTADGQVLPQAATDERQRLRIIDVKLTSEPGAQYFAELAFYCLALAAWLDDNNLGGRFAVSAEPAIWPGSERMSDMQVATAAGAAHQARLDGFHTGLEVAPARMFIADTLRVLRTIIPEVLATPFNELPWAVTPMCQGCEHLGQKFKAEPGTAPSDWDPRHCLPLAETTQHLSRLPFLSRGATKTLRDHGIDQVSDVAALPSTDGTFDAHHRLRGQRTIVNARANALTGTAVEPLPNTESTTVAIPGFQNLRIYISADFDPGSAISLVFGLHWGWWHTSGATISMNTPRVHSVSEKTPEAEWAALQQLLDGIDELLTQAARIDPNATVQVLVWDSVTFDHLTRVIGRHLGAILRTERLSRLAWLFPPEQVLESGTLASTPAVSIVRDAVTTLLSIDLAHTYTLIETARRFHPARLNNATFYVPTFWHDPFSDQIPPERAHQFWNPRPGLNAPTHEQLAANMFTTVRSKLFALGSVHEELVQRLRGRLPRRAPKVSQITHPSDEGGTSHLGVLLLAHAQLDAALQELNLSRTRALPIEEREAKFESARLPRRLRNTERAAELTQHHFDPADPHLQAFEMNPASAQVGAKEGEFTWVILPENQAHHLRDTFGSFLWQSGNEDLKQTWASDWQAKRTRLDSLFGVEILKLDRQRGRLVVRFNTWGSSVPMRRSLIDHHLLQLDEALVLDKKSVDAFPRRLKDVVKAIGNPPAADRNPAVQAALGITRTPRTSPVIHAQDFLWDALPTTQQSVPADVDRLLEDLRDHNRLLNPSQQIAWEHALTRRLTIIWGPPGTGKTATVRTILRSLAALGSPLRIAVAAHSYTAVDNVLRGMREHLDEAAPTTHLRRIRSQGRPAAEWLTEAENVNSADPDALAALGELLTGPETVIVGGTPTQLQHVIKESTSGAAGAVFDVIVLDEAGQIDVAHSTLVLAGAAAEARLIVAGDPKQLPPIHAAEAPVGLEPLVGSAFDFFTTWHRVQPLPLLTNYRSNSHIVDLARLAGYPDELSAHNGDRRLQLTPDGSAFHAARAIPEPAGAATVEPALFDVLAPDRPVVALTYDDGASGQWNQFEADVVVRLCVALWHLTGNDDVKQFWGTALGVVTPHRAQRALVIRGLTDTFAHGQHHERVRQLIEDAVDTVERFQGQERDTILATFAVGDPDTVSEEAEFLHNLNRFNVLATRARDKLVVIASREVLDHLDSDLEVLRSSELIKEFADVFCNHSAMVALQSPTGVVDVDFRWHDGSPT